MRTYRPVNIGYGDAGASTTKRALKSVPTESHSAVEDILPYLETLRARSKLLAISSPVAAAAINTMRTHVIGPGLTMQSTIDTAVLGISDEEAADWQNRTEAEFRLWAESARNCDASGMNNFYEMQQIVFRSALESGDSFALIKYKNTTPQNPYGLRLYALEADRICTPDTYGIVNAISLSGAVIPEGKDGAGNRIFDGVEVDRDGEVIAYHVASDYPNAVNAVRDKITWSRILARGEKTGLPNILHVLVPERCEQYRGVPLLAPVIEVLLQLRRYTESELMAALVKSMFTAWITTDGDTSDIPINEVGATSDITAENGQNIDVTGTGSTNENDYQMGVGTVIHLAPGENIVFGNPNVADAGFETFVHTLCKLLGAALEIPYDVLIKEFNSSYSASRGALMEAWEMFKMRRSWFVSDFCQQVYEIWLSEAVARGRIHAPGFFADPLTRKAWSGAKWIGPVQVQLDPVKEANANVTNVNNGFKTRTQVTRESGGGDYQSNVRQAKREIELLVSAGLNPAGTYERGGNEDE